MPKETRHRNRIEPFILQTLRWRPRHGYSIGRPAQPSEVIARALSPRGEEGEG